MESKFHSKRILVLLTILPLLASISIVNNFEEAFAKSELDFKQCTGFLSVDEVKTTIGYSNELEVINSDTTQQALETHPNLQTQCTVTFKPTSFESAVTLMVSEFNSTEAADERYSKSLESFLTAGGFTGFKGEFVDWKTFEVNSDKMFVKNLLAAQYLTYVIALSTPPTDEDIALADDLKNLSTIVLKKIGMDADIITQDRADLKIEVEETLLELAEKAALDKSGSAPDQISEGDPLTEAPIHEEKTMSEGDPLTEAPIHEEKTMSPYYQLKMGTATKDINCNEGLELIFNPLSGSPNCVKPYTASVLIKRGWTTT